ncbi:hypothetical protein [uncultured Brevundimonas sp.]|uniref:hypothetical protein n=1 Tax=uncultured Brevundimonas sp. TaxID=213418 RepID=UPI0025EE0B61|nr:hypothetical protein [uncultured Brevundimonas sp.]
MARPPLIATSLAALTAATPALAQIGPPQPMPAEILADRADELTAAFLPAHVVAGGPVTGGLTSDLPARDRVVTLAGLSLDSAVQIPAPTPTFVQRMRLTDLNIDGPFVKVQGSAILRAASRPDRIFVFDPGGAGTLVKPVNSMSIRSSVGQAFDLDPPIPSSDYAQHIGVFRGSDRAAPREQPAP